MRPLSISTLLAIPALTTLALASPAFAGPVAIHPGLKAGMSVSNFSGNLHDLANLDTRSQMTFGGYVRFDVARTFSLQPEIVYVPKGAKSTSTAVDSLGNPLGTITSTYKLNYLEFPVLAKVRFPMAGKLSPNLFVAPTAALNLVRKIENEGPAGAIPAGAEEMDLKDEVEKFDFGGSIGGGMDLGMGPGQLSLDARYDLGLREIFTAAGAANDKNRTLTVTLGYTF